MGNPCPPCPLNNFLFINTLSLCSLLSSPLHARARKVWGVDSVKSTVSVLEEGDFSEEGGGFNWRWRIPVFVEECISISRRESSASGVGDHTSLGEGWILISRRGSSASGVGGHTSLGEGWILIARRVSTSSGVGGSHTFVGGSRRALVHLK